MTDINIKESIPDKGSFFNIKRFSLRGLGNNFLRKTIDIKDTGKGIIENLKELKTRDALFEKSKVIKNFQVISNLMQEEDSKVNSFFSKKAWLNDRFTVFNSILKFNPYAHIKKLEEIEGFLHYYYTYSKNILLIPNIQKDKVPYENGKAQKKETIITLKEYIRFVEEMHEFFSQMNNKPIFVPVSLRFNIKELKELIEYYLKKEFFYLWVDFEAKNADISNDIIHSKIRQINTILRNSKNYDKCLVFMTNIRREIIANIKDDKSPASDILGTLCGANLVGVNRSPQIFFEGMKEKTQEVREHKAREFDKDSYYYLVKKGQMISKPLNITNNSIKLGSEFDSQKEYF